ncbi:MAG TPA: NAD(P)H-binding protein [Dehalococcoidia bacterium]|nr:NAD(P)H-binding protein [Dehalococcoidia bacterium]
MLLVSGGTGFIGSAIVRELLGRGERVAVLGRDASRIRRLFGESVEAREADVTRAGQDLDAAMQGVDVVINSVQFPNSPIENKARGWTFENVDLNGTRNQVDSAKKAGVRRFVYISGAGAAADAAQHWFRLKWQAEEYVKASGLEWVIIRPTWVYGPDDNSLNRILRFASFLPFIPTFGSGKQAMQPVFIDDVARVTADAALKPEAANHLFELGGPEVMTMDDVFRTALEVMGRRRPILHQPVVVGKLLGKAASLLPNKPLSADAVDFIVQPAVADNRELEAVLAPKLTPLREGLASYLGK